MSDYKFPIKDKFDARDVLEQNFDATKYPEIIVDLTDIRTTNKFNNYRKTILEALKIEKDKLERNLRAYPKIIFSGYRGSGKSIELWKFNSYINNPERYFTVFINLEEEVELTKFEFEDFFIVLIFRLIQRLQEVNINALTIVGLKDILNDWYREEEIVREVKRQAELEGSAEVSTEVGFWNFFKSKFKLKAALATSNTFSKIIREKTGKNILTVIEKLNIALDSIRAQINEENIGKEILFIIDGSEKIFTHVYQKIFITDSYAFRHISAPVISSVPIYSYYDMEQNNAQLFYERVLLPVVKLNNKKSVGAFEEIIKNRIDFETFFENEQVLEYFVKMSGGVIRQLLKLVNFALLYKEQDKLTLDESKEIVYEFGRRMYERLGREDKEFIKENILTKNEENDINPADELDGRLVFGLFILKYNGHYDLNPVLKHFFEK